uniref:F-box domain-containing protein n=1 Tax=Steinernema glaseri TaxID=37863 RepID=A0A1I7ZLP0_9BILA
MRLIGSGAERLSSKQKVAVRRKAQNASQFAFLGTTLADFGRAASFADPPLTATQISACFPPPRPKPVPVTRADRRAIAEAQPRYQRPRPSATVRADRCARFGAIDSLICIQSPSPRSRALRPHSRHSASSKFVWSVDELALLGDRTSSCWGLSGGYGGIRAAGGGPLPEGDYGLRSRSAMDALPETVVDAIVSNLPCFTAKELFDFPGSFGEAAREHIGMAGDLCIDVAFYTENLVFTCQVESLATMERSILPLDSFDPDYVRFLRVGELRIASFPRFNSDDYVDDPRSFAGLLHILSHWRASADRTSQLQLSNITPAAEAKLLPLLEHIGIGFDEIMVIRSSGPAVHRLLKQQLGFGTVKRVQLAESNIKPYEIGFQDAIVAFSQQPQMRTFTAEAINFDFVRRLAREWMLDMRFGGTTFVFSTTRNTWDKLRAQIEGLQQAAADEWSLSSLREDGAHEELRFRFTEDPDLATFPLIARGNLRVYEIEY